MNSYWKCRAKKFENANSLKSLEGKCTASSSSISRAPEVVSDTLFSAINDILIIENDFPEMEIVLNGKWSFSFQHRMLPDSCTSYFKIPAILVTVTKHYNFVQHNTETPCLLFSAVEVYSNRSCPFTPSYVHIWQKNHLIKVIILQYCVLVY